MNNFLLYIFIITFPLKNAENIPFICYLNMFKESLKCGFYSILNSETFQFYFCFMLLVIYYNSQNFAVFFSTFSTTFFSDNLVANVFVLLIFH